MPGGNRSGPEGMGSRTGRGLGYCTGYDNPGYTKGFSNQGAGVGFGGGQRIGRGLRRDLYNTYEDRTEPATPLVQKQVLQKEQELIALKKDLKFLDDRIKKLEAEK